jgi:hypothetical protein
MTYETINNVKYYLKGDFYIVGDNSSTRGNGITSQSYSGEITIQSTVNNKPVLEIGQYAFGSCKSITKVFIDARIRSINECAFSWCGSINYINIPSTVTFIAYAAFILNYGDGGTPEPPATLEFNTGRTSELFLAQEAIGYRKNIFIIYPSNTIPTCPSSITFTSVTTAIICAPSSFNFCARQTTTDQSKCPAPRLITATPSIAATIQNIIHVYHTCNFMKASRTIFHVSLMVMLSLK